MKALRLKAVASKLGVSTSAIWKWTKEDPQFPKPFKLSEKATAWAEHELDQWLLTRLQMRDAPAIGGGTLA